MDIWNASVQEICYPSPDCRVKRSLKLVDEQVTLQERGELDSVLLRSAVGRWEMRFSGDHLQKDRMNRRVRALRHKYRDLSVILGIRVCFPVLDASMVLVSRGEYARRSISKSDSSEAEAGKDLPRRPRVSLTDAQQVCVLAAHQQSFVQV